jgi:N-acetylglucosaminyldiphosphoundecaprenol N-acetyl-beta-D-mannosaminyltransferase
MPTTRRVLNIDVCNMSIETLLGEFTSGVVVPLNIDTFITLQHDEEFYKVCRRAEYRVLDSQVLYFAAKFTRASFKEKIAGSDLLPRFCEYHKTHTDIKMYILGGLNDVATRVQDNLNRNAGRQLVVGAHSPSLEIESNADENSAIIKEINSTPANVLVVGLGAPKQEKWIMRHRAELKNVTMYIAVGATLDFIAGTQRRAPHWMQTSGLEWFYRLGNNPRRMFRRYIVRDIPFFYYFLRDALGMYKNPFKG